MDVKSAFFFRRVRRPIFIEVPTEGRRSQLDGVLAKWVGSLYGARDAPMIWQDCLRCQMKLLGFKESLRLPRMLYRETKGLEMIAHVDDLFVGCLKDVQEVHRGLADSFEIKCTYAGPKTGNSEDEYLGQCIVFTENGPKINGDPRHAAFFLLKETGMKLTNINDKLDTLLAVLCRSLHKTTI